MTYTTDKDFELFKRECNKHINLFGLSDWNYVFYHSDLSNIEDLEDANAVNTTYYKAKTAVLRLNMTFNELDKTKKQMIIDIAKHEVLHILLSNLSTMAFSRSIDAEIYNSEEHAVINRLQKAFEK